MLQSPLFPVVYSRHVFARLFSVISKSLPPGTRQTLPMHSNQHKTVRGKSFTNNAEK